MRPTANRGAKLVAQMFKWAAAMCAGRKATRCAMRRHRFVPMEIGLNEPTRQELSKLLNSEATPDTVDQGLRLGLSALIIRGLKTNGWSQKQLAKQSHMTEADISALLKTKRNWTVRKAGSVLFALGITDVDLVDLQASSDDARYAQGVARSIGTTGQTMPATRRPGRIRRRI